MLTYLTAPPFDWSFAKLRLDTWARDYDGGWSDNENAYGSSTLIGGAMLGPKSLNLSCADFTAHFDVQIDLLYTAPNPPPAPASVQIGAIH